MCRREPSGEIQGVAFAKRHIEFFAEPLDHRPARVGLPGFDEAQVARRDTAGARQVELGKAPPDPPLTNKRAHGFLRHDTRLSRALESGNYLRGNCLAAVGNDQFCDAHWEGAAGAVRPL